MATPNDIDVITIAYVGAGVFTVSIMEPTLTTTTFNFSTSFSTPNAFSNGITYDSVANTITVPAGVSTFNFSLANTKSASALITIDEVEYSAISIQSITFIDDGVYLIRLTSPTFENTDFKFAVNGAIITNSNFDNGVTYNGVAGTITVPLSNNLSAFTFTLSTGDENTVIEIGDTIFPESNPDLSTTVQGITYTNLGFVVQLSEVTSEEVRFSFISTHSYPVSNNGVLYDDPNKEVIVPAGINSFVFNLANQADLIGTTVTITVGGVQVVEVISNSIIPSDDPNLDALRSIAESLALIASRLTLMETHHRRIKELCDVEGVKSVGKYDNLNATAIYKLLVENGSSKDKPLLEITSIRSNVCSTENDHNLTVGDEYIPSESRNGFVKHVVYTVSEIISPTEFKVSGLELTDGGPVNIEEENPNWLAPIKGRAVRKDTSELSTYASKLQDISDF
jgi:hypothetical protein